MSDSSVNESDFESIRAACLREKCLYEDPEFPAIDKSIYTSKAVSNHISWKRPPEFCANPQFIVNGLTRFDLDQGELGNCWFIAAASTLATKPRLMETVVPPNQSFTDNYAGIFHFKFWRYGSCKEVIIDDRLPVKYSNQLKFCHSTEENDEFWGALLEKAYAKLNGSYEALIGGKIQDALVDLTGGVSEVIDLADKSKNNNDLFTDLQRMEASNSLMGCAISVLGKGAAQSFGNAGLLSGHAYSITGLARVAAGTQKVRLIRLLNPWGKSEWTGAWCDSSSEWNYVEDNIKQKLNFKALEDGEFWMSFDEWRNTFTELQLCHLTSKSYDSKVDWFQQEKHGRWVKGVNAGGCGIHPYEEFYWDNPQYCIVLKNPDIENCSFIVSLMQKDRQLAKQMTYSASIFTIGFRLFQIISNEPLALNNAIYPNETIMLEKGMYNQFREVAHHYDDVEPGVYCVIPTTYQPNEEAEFFLRVLTHHKAELGEPDELKQKSRGAGTRSYFLDKDVLSISRPMSKRARGISGAIMSTSFEVEVSEPLLTSTKSQQLSRSASEMQSTGIDETDNEKHSDLSLTPSDEEVLEIFGTYVKPNTVVDVNLLQQLLSSLNEIGQLGCYRISFSQADARVMFSLLDSWQDRLLTFESLKYLIKLLKEWIKEFAIRDRDYAEFLPFSELWKLFSSLGFNLNNDTKIAVVISYGENKTGLYVSDFIRCVAKISAINSYWLAKNRDDNSSISLQELLERVLVM